MIFKHRNIVIVSINRGTLILQEHLTKVLQDCILFMHYLCEGFLPWTLYTEIMYHRLLLLNHLLHLLSLLAVECWETREFILHKLLFVVGRLELHCEHFDIFSEEYLLIALRLLSKVFLLFLKDSILNDKLLEFIVEFLLFHLLLQ